MEGTKGGKDRELKKFYRFSWEKLNLKCEWDVCGAIIDEMPIFLDHVEEHMRAIQEGDFECKWEDCGVAWTSFQDMYCHVFYHAFHTKLKCYGKNFLIRKKMPECALDAQGHNIVPDIPSDLVCYWNNCECVYHNPEVFYRHVGGHVEEFPKGNYLNNPIKCLWLGCTSTFTSPYKLKEHMRTHTQEKMLACPTCGGMFSSRTKFVDHIDRQAIAISDKKGDISFFNCAFCGSQFPTERLLKDHMRNHVNQYKCPYCDMTASSLSALRIHIGYRHSSYRPLACEYCDYKCKRAHDLRKHLEIHSSEPSYHCPMEECEESFRTHSTFVAHFRRFHEQGESKPVYMCHLCVKTFSRGYYLTKHLIVKHNFKNPLGQPRFRYERDADGIYKLRMVRYESVEVTETTIEVQNDRHVLDVVPKSSSDDEEKGAANNTQGISVPLMMYVPNPSDEGNKDTSEGNLLQGISQDPVLLEIHGSEGNTLLTSDGSAVVYLHPSVNAASHKGQKTLQIINQDNEGRTVVQTAVVLAEGGDAENSVLVNQMEESSPSSETMDTK